MTSWSCSSTLSTFEPTPALTRQGWAGKVAALANIAIDRIGYGAASPNAAEIIAAVRDQPGVHALESWDVRDALEQWCHSLRREADLNGIGRLAAHWDAVRMLRSLCRMAEEEARDPSSLEETIEAPIFITGMPRSGTTFLHRLLAEDPTNAVLRCWQGISPFPPRHGSDRRRRRAEHQLRMLHRLAPGLAAAHPLTADTPQECSELMAPTFRSFRFDTTHHVPSYRRWLNEISHDKAYSLHRRFLQHMQHRTRQRRWVLKCPDHMFTLGALQRAYPDACYVFLHRDPLKVLPSAARLTQLIRAPFARTVDPAVIGRQVANDCHDNALRMIAAAQSPAVPASQVIHLHYSTVRDRPLDAVSAIYRQFGLDLTVVAQSAIEAEIARFPDGGYGHNVYQFEAYAIDAARERERFRCYTDYFDISWEIGT